MGLAELGERLVAATAARTPVPTGSGRVAITIGKTNAVTLVIADGVVVEVDSLDVADAATADGRIPFTKAQLGEYIAGHWPLTEAYMKGDLKPEGRSGPLLAMLEILDAPEVLEALTAAPA